MSIAVRKQIVIPHEIPFKAGDTVTDQMSDRTLLVHMIHADEAPADEQGSSKKMLSDRSDWLSWFASCSLPAQPADIRVVIGFSEAFDPQAVSVLSAMRDLSGLPVIVAARRNSSLSEEQRNQLRALGFTGQQAKDKDAYVFNIANYKETPEWLNARNWANPELWDKFRW